MTTPQDTQLTDMIRRASVAYGEFTDKEGFSYSKCPRKERFRLLSVVFGQYSTIQLARIFHVSQRTIERDIQAFGECDEYWKMLDIRWYQMLNSKDIPEIEKFRALTTLKKQRLMAVMVSKSVEGSSVTIEIVDDTRQMSKAEAKP